MPENLIRSYSQDVAEFEAGVLDLCILTNSNRIEFINSFNQWLSEMLISWGDGLEILRQKTGRGESLPWDTTSSTPKL